MVAALHLLVVEDNAVNQVVARRLLESQGHRVDIAENGAEAVDAVRRTTYQAVLMDCQMPVMDGYQATRIIRAAEGGSRHTPIIAMTAGAMAEDRERCLAAGMDDYIAKPVRGHELAEVLQRWTNRHNGQRVDRDVTAPPGPLGEPRSAVLDPTVIAQLAELDQGHGGVAELVAMYVHDAQARIEELHIAIREHNATEIKQISHSLKGSSANLGARDLAAICAELEQTADNSFADSSRAVHRAEAELTLVRTALEQAFPPASGN